MGSMREHCYWVAFHIEKVYREFDINIEPFWLRRDAMPIAVYDKFSKDVETSDYGIQGIFQEVGGEV